MTVPVVQIIREFSTEGGVETVAFELQRAWRQAGHDPVALACTGWIDPASGVRPIASWLRRVPTRGRWRHAGRLLAVPGFTLAAEWRQRRAARGAIILSHGDSFSGDVVIVHAVNRESLVRKARAGDYRFLLNPLHAWVSFRDRLALGGGRFRRYVAVSGRIKEELQNHYRIPDDRIVVIPNGIDLDRFAPTGADEGIRARFGIPESAKLLLFVGHEFERKGLIHVIDALAELPADVHLLVVGSDDPARARARAAELKVADRVTFAGAQRDLPAFYRASDAFVFPTAYESFSLVCMEALASGKPVFATRVGGIEDYLRDGENGFFIQADGRDIADKLRPVLADPSSMAALVAGARRTAENYAWARVAERYQALFEELAAEDARAPARR